MLYSGYFSGFGTWVVTTNLWGSLPFSSPLPFPPPSPSLPLYPSFPPEAGGCCAKVGGINPPDGGVGNSLVVFRDVKTQCNTTLNLN